MIQAQQLAWIKEHRPEVFAEVKKKVADGQFLPVGGMWVESDTNMVGGEAMAPRGSPPSSRSARTAGCGWRSRAGVRRSSTTRRTDTTSHATAARTAGRPRPCGCRCCGRPRYPDPETDQGHHRLRYALAPGASVVDAVREGHWFNLPERRMSGTGPVEPLVRVDSDQVVVEAVKLAEDRSGDVVVRLYESAGGRAAARLTAGFPAAGVAATDLLERPLEDAGEYEVSEDGGFAVALRPFQILTLRLSQGS